MKCILVLLSLAVFTYAVPVTTGPGKQVTVDEDGTITITGDDKKIVIGKAIGTTGPKEIDITVGGPSGLTKKIHIDSETNTKTVDLLDNEMYKLNQEEREKRSSKDTKEMSKSNKSYKSSKSQGDVLSKLFKQYQEVIDEKSYNNFLAMIDTAVQSGEVNPAVYDILRSLDQYRLAETNGYQGLSTYRGYPYGNSVQYQSGFYPTVDQQDYYYGPRETRFPVTQQMFSQQQLQTSGVNPWSKYMQSTVPQKRMMSPFVGYMNTENTYDY